ncbi:uncharacterized protein LOC135694209 [Rhopilema esculentum]|uniref:uncharacterized protein LOC135694209 n=1 Tax=Rhopilema esculentum TaxID=499914 RepID=UPI0031DB3FB4|eukprot:gene10728-19508_t
MDQESEVVPTVFMGPLKDMECTAPIDVISEREGFTCDSCGIPFFSYTRYAKHRNLHTERKPFRCTYCGESFSYVIELHNHKEEEHMCKKSFKCPDCPKTFASRMALSEHSWRHTGDKLHQCSICCKRFSSKGNLKIHAEKHLYMKNYACGLCPREFVSYSSLERHMSKHSGFKPYKCSFCPSRFLQVFQLRNHERKHRGDKSFKCLKCDKAFYSNSACRNHQKKHHSMQVECPKNPEQCSSIGQKIYFEDCLATNKAKSTQITCPFCKKLFNASCNLTKHLLRHDELSLTVTEAKSFAKALKQYLVPNQTTAGLPFQEERVQSEHVPLSEVVFLKEPVSKQRKFPIKQKQTESSNLRNELNRSPPCKCQFCGRAFNLHKNLRRHIIKSHPENAKMMGISNELNSQLVRGLRECLMNDESNMAKTDFAAKSQLLKPGSSLCKNKKSKRRAVCNKDVSEKCKVSNGENKVLKCWLCPQTFLSAAAVVIHMTNDHDNQQYQSDISESSATNPNEIHSFSAASQQKANALGSNSYSCLKCKKTFSSQAILSMHEIAHKILAIDTDSSVSCHDRKSPHIDSAASMSSESTSGFGNTESNSSLIKPKRLWSSNASVREASPLSEQHYISLNPPGDSVPCTSNISNHFSNIPKGFNKKPFYRPDTEKGLTVKPCDQSLSSIMAAVEALCKGPESCSKPEATNIPALQVSNVRSLRRNYNGNTFTPINSKSSKYPNTDNNAVDDVIKLSSPDKDLDKRMQSFDVLSLSKSCKETSSSISQLSKLCATLLPDYLPVSQNPSGCTRMTVEEFPSNGRSHQPSTFLIDKPMTNSNCTVATSLSSSRITKNQETNLQSRSRGVHFPQRITIANGESPLTSAWNLRGRSTNCCSKVETFKNRKEIVNVLEAPPSFLEDNCVVSVDDGRANFLSTNEGSRDGFPYSFENCAKNPGNETHDVAGEASYAIPLETRPWHSQQEATGLQFNMEMQPSISCQSLYNNQPKTLQKAIHYAGTKPSPSDVSKLSTSVGSKLITAVNDSQNRRVISLIQSDLSLDDPVMNIHDKCFPLERRVQGVKGCALSVAQDRTSGMIFSVSDPDIPSTNDPNRRVSVHVPPVVSTSQKPPEGFKIGYTLAYVPVLIPDNGTQVETFLPTTRDRYKSKD